MAQNRQMGAGMMPPPASPANPTAVNFQSDPNMRQQFKGFMSGLSKRMEQQQPAMQAPLPMPMPMQNVDIFQPMPMAMGGSVPRSTNIAGQPHMLSYITPGEAGILQSMGGSGAPGPGGIPSFFLDEGMESYTGDTGSFSSGDYSADSGSTNFSSGSSNFSSDDSDSGSTTGLNLTYSDGTPAGVAIRGNTITGGTITGGSDPVAAGFGGGSSSGVDDSAEFLGVPQFGVGRRPFAQMSRAVIPSTIDITDDLRAGASRDALSSALSSAQRSMLNDAYAQQARDTLSSPLTGPLSTTLSTPISKSGFTDDLRAARTNLLLDADAVANLAAQDANLLMTDFGGPEERSREAMDAEAQRLSMGGGQVNVDSVTGALSSIPVPIAMPDAVREQRALSDIQAMQNPFNRGESAGERVAQGQPSGQVQSIYDIDPNYEENVGNPNFLSDAGRELKFTLKGSSLPENQKFNREAAELAADEGEPIFAPGASAAEVQAAINAARATGDSAFTRQSEIGRLADLMDRRTTVTLADPKNKPGRVDPNTGLPINVDARSVSSLEQLGRRAGRGQTGIMGLVDKYTGFNPAERMYNDIIEKGYSPVYDSRGQIIATVNPKTGQIGAGSRPIDMNAISETGGDLKAFIYNQFADQNVFGGGGDDGGQPDKPDLLTPPKPDPDVPDEDDDIIDAPTPPPVVIPPFQTGEAAKVANPLGFGYGQYTPTGSNLESSVDKFIKMLGGR
tara:strand:+ start:812 stop:3007 length:2196 start_codon:yes stop_codon:yes gene_type:complete